MAKSLANLRVGYAVLALLIGGLLLIGHLAFGVSNGFEAIRHALAGPPALAPSPELPSGVTIVENPYGLDSGWDTIGGRFTVFVGAPAYAAIIFLAGVFALRRKWELLRLACWAQLPALVGVLVDSAWLSEWTSDWSPLQFLRNNPIEIVIALWPVAGLVIAWSARASLPVKDDDVSTPIPSPAFALTILSVVAALAYIVRAVVTGLGPAGDWVIAFASGATHAQYQVYEKELSQAATAVVAAAALLLAVVAFWTGRKQALSGALAFACAVAFAGFLDLLDVLIGDDFASLLSFHIYDAVVFFTSAAALVIWYGGEKRRQLFAMA